MANILPTTIARPTGGIVSGGDTSGVSFYEAAGIELMTNQMAGNIQGVSNLARDYASKQELIKRNEEQTQVSQASSKVLIDLKSYQKNTLQTNDLKAISNMTQGTTEAFDKSLEAHTDGLSTKQIELVKSQLRTNVYAIQKNGADSAARLSTNMYDKAINTQLQTNIGLAITTHLDTDKSQDLTTTTALDNLDGVLAGKGMKTTPEQISELAKYSGLSYDPAKQSLDEFRAGATSQIADASEGKKKELGLLVHAINSAIVVDAERQKVVDRIQSGRIDEYINAGDYTSVDNFMAKIDPEDRSNEGNYTVSSTVYAKLKEYTSQRLAPIKATAALKSVSATISAGVNPVNLDPKLQAKNDKLAWAQVNSITDPKVRELAKKGLRTMLKEGAKQTAQIRADKIQEVSSYWVKNNTDAISRERQIENMRASADTEIISKLQKVNSHMSEDATKTIAGVMGINSAVADATFAAREGYGTLDDGSRYRISNKEEFTSYYYEKGGTGTPQAMEKRLSAAYRDRNKIVDNKAFTNWCYDNKLNRDLMVKRGVIDMVREMLDGIENPTYEQTMNALNKMAASTVTVPGWVYGTNEELVLDIWKDGDPISAGTAKQLYDISESQTGVAATPVTTSNYMKSIGYTWDPQSKKYVYPENRGASSIGFLTGSYSLSKPKP